MPYIPNHARRLDLLNRINLSKTEGELNFVFYVELLREFYRVKKYATIHMLSKLYHAKDIYPLLDFTKLHDLVFTWSTEDIQTAAREAFREFTWREIVKYESAAVVKNGDVKLDKEGQLIDLCPEKTSD